MFSFKKKKKSSSDNKDKDKDSIGSQKSSKGGFLSRRKSKSKSSLVSLEVSLNNLSVTSPNTNGSINNGTDGHSDIPRENKTNGQTDFTLNVKNTNPALPKYVNNQPPGYQILGQLASEVEGLQRQSRSESSQGKKDSPKKALQANSETGEVKSYNAKPLGALQANSETGEVKSYNAKPLESWKDAEVLEWLHDNELSYFVELFEGCEIDGDYLMQINEEDLIDLDVDEPELRLKLLNAVKDLGGHLPQDDLNTTNEEDQTETFKSEDQFSLPGLNANDDSKSNPEDSWESDDDSESEWSFGLPGDEKKKNEHAGKVEKKTTQDLRVRLKEPEQIEEEILRPPTVFREVPSRFEEKRIEDWVECDIMQWLSSVGLEKLAERFDGSGITGKQLKNIDMSFLDKMEITKASDREALLSNLYKLTHPDIDVVDDEVISAINEVSKYEKQKYQAALSVLQSPTSDIELLPPESGNDITFERTDSVLSTASMLSTASETSSRTSVSGEKKKKRGSISKLKKAFRSKDSKNQNIVRVWTDVGTAKDKPVRLKLELEEDSTSGDLVQDCLSALNMLEDPRLYCIAEVLVADNKEHSTVTDREMEIEESPLKVRRNWRESLSGHFELRQRTAQGGVIKLVLRLPNEQPKGKLISLSLSTPANELIPLALKKFGLMDAEPSSFCLMEVDKAGDIQDITEDIVPMQRESHAYVLCAKNAKDPVFDFATPKSQDSQNEEIERSESVTSRTSKISGVSLGSSAGSIDLSAALLPDNEKLSKLEKEMASIEESLEVVGRSKSLNIPKKHQAVKKEKDGRSPRSSLKMDARLQQLEEENKQLQENLKQFETMQIVFKQLKSSLDRLQTETNLKLLQRRQASSPDLDSLPRDLAQPMFHLENISQEIETQQAKINKMKKEIEQKRITNSDSTTSSSRNSLAIEEASLIGLKFEQARLLCMMEVTMTDYQLSVMKRRDLSENKSISCHLPTNQMQSIFSANVSAGDEGYQFGLGTADGRDGVFIDRCPHGTRIRSGDRILEINNHCVLNSSIADVNTKLNSTSTATLVLLREMDHDVIHLNAKVTDLEEQLESAATRLEEDHREADFLREEVLKLKESLELPNPQLHQQHVLYVTENHIPNKNDIITPENEVKKNVGDILQEIDNDMPLWEAMKSFSKGEILEVFREELQEAGRQKQYLDQLYTLMLEKAPHLLQVMEEDNEASDLSGDEEFC